jgi:hypothetical protein
MGARRASSSAAALWARADVRRRWRSLVALGLLAGLTAGFAFAALAGARRTDTALDRLRQRTNASDAIVFSSQVGVIRPDWSKLEARPEVERLARWALLFGELEGEPGGVLFGSVDGTWAGDVDRPVVIKGRMFNPRASDEMVVDEIAARDGYDVGDVVPFHAYAIEQIEDDDGGPATGPNVGMRVVGVVRNLAQFVFVTDGQGLVSPGFVARYRDEAVILENANVQLRDGAAGMAALQRDVNLDVAPGTPVLDQHNVARRVTTTLDVERTALLLLGGVVALAGLVLVGQAIARSAAEIGDDAPTLRALGMTRSQLVGAALRSHVLVAVLGAGIALVTAVVASAWFPVGLARKVDPLRGVHADWAVLGPGAVAVAVLMLSATALIAWLTCRTPEGAAARVHLGPVAWVRRAAPVALGLGTTMAFDGGSGRRRVPVRPALVGAVAGVLGVVATMTIDHGLTDALRHPERAGVAWDAQVRPLESDFTPSGVRAGLVDRVRRHPDVASVAEVDRMVTNVRDLGVPTFTVRPPPRSGSSIGLVLIDGRSPQELDEAVIGPATAELLHVGIGDTVVVGPSATRMRIVGKALFPSEVHATFDEGVWLAPSAWDAAVPAPDENGDLSIEPIVVVRFRDGVELEPATSRLGKALGDGVGVVETVEVPPELTNLRNVRSLPTLLAGFLALLAVAALGHVLATSVRRRRHEFAVLRALGVTRRGVRLILSAQGTAIGLAGILLGIPLGLAVGRMGWQALTDQVPLLYASPFGLLAVVAVVPAVIGVANLLAVWPGHRAAKLRPAEVLRSE